MMSDKIWPHHLGRKAILYFRQSSSHQVLYNRESRALQYTTRVGSRRSGITAASFPPILVRRAAAASSITPPSDDRCPPSNAAVSFLPWTAGNQNGIVVSSVTAGVAGSIGWTGLASITDSYATSIA